MMNASRSPSGSMPEMSLGARVRARCTICAGTRGARGRGGRGVWEEAGTARGAGETRGGVVERQQVVSRRAGGL